MGTLRRSRSQPPKHQKHKKTPDSHPHFSYNCPVISWTLNDAYAA